MPHVSDCAPHVFKMCLRQKKKHFKFDTYGRELFYYFKIKKLFMYIRLLKIIFQNVLFFGLY